MTGDLGIDGAHAAVHCQNFLLEHDRDDGDDRDNRDEDECELPVDEQHDDNAAEHVHGAPENIHKAPCQNRADLAGIAH